MTENKKERFEKAIEYHRILCDVDSVNVEELKQYAEELIYCEEHKISLIDYDCWLAYENLVNEKFSYDTYKLLDTLYDNDPLELDKEADADKQIITDIKNAYDFLKNDFNPIPEIKKEDFVKVLYAFADGWSTFACNRGYDIFDDYYDTVEGKAVKGEHIERIDEMEVWDSDASAAKHYSKTNKIPLIEDIKGLDAVFIDTPENRANIMSQLGFVKSVTRAWKVYGTPGHRQKESFNDSYKYDFSKENDIRILEVENSDKNGTNEYSIIRTTRNTYEECYDEFFGQLSDGVFENCRTGHHEEIKEEMSVVLKDECALWYVMNDNTFFKYENSALKNAEACVVVQDYSNVNVDKSAIEQYIDKHFSDKVSASDKECEK